MCGVSLRLDSCRSDSRQPAPRIMRDYPTLNASQQEREVLYRTEHCDVESRLRSRK